MQVTTETSLTLLARDHVEAGCLNKFANFSNFSTSGLYCNWTWDTVLCWPPTEAGTDASQPCPPGKGVDPTKLAHKRCASNGLWQGKTLDVAPNAVGWTNYTPCFYDGAREMLDKLYSGSEEAAKTKIAIAEYTRTLEIVGFSISLTALLISLAIFCHFRTLRNNRTRIHRNLFIAMVIQVVIRLTLYIDQAVIREPRAGGRAPAAALRHRQGIDNTPILCEASYVLLEYARTAMFMWMFVEGLYLHNMITVTVFQEQSYFHFYTLVGWGAPIVMTSAWAATTAVHYGSSKCWWGYNLTKYFWILEGPRLGVIVLNLMFLLNIIRVLVVKLRQTQTSELEQVRKAVRAALLLLPLLGITNLLNMTDAPLDRAVWEFAVWSFTTHFLTSFQGLFIAFLYCFLNGEVRTAVAKSVSVYLSLRQNLAPRRNSAYSGVYMTADHDVAVTVDGDVEEPDACRLCCCCCRSESVVPTSPPPQVPETLV